jgi:2-methylcitrate dehydratase PrpD
MPATQALREILEIDISAKDIFEVETFVLPPHLKMIDHGVKIGDLASYLTSLPYQLAVAALQPAKMADLNLAVEVPLPAMQAFMARVKVVADETLLADYPACWPARILVTTSSGSRERRVDHVPGDPARPFTATDMRNKFQHFVAPIAGEATTKILQSSFAALQTRETLSSLMHDLDGVMARADA